MNQIETRFCGGPEGHNQFTARNDKGILYVDIWYARVTEAKAVDIGLVDVRASDSIRVIYSFERNGWIIQQASIFEWEFDDKVMDEDWLEVAFIPSWGREKAPPRDLVTV